MNKLTVVVPLLLVGTVVIGAMVIIAQVSDQLVDTKAQAQELQETNAALAQELSELENSSFILAMEYLEQTTEEFAAVENFGDDKAAAWFSPHYGNDRVELFHTDRDLFHDLVDLGRANQYESFVFFDEWGQIIADLFIYENTACLSFWYAVSYDICE